MSSRADQLAAELNTHRSAFKAFLAARVGSEAEAEDILQNGLLKALQRADELQDDAKLTAWFYQLLRNAVVDHYRARDSVRHRHDALGETLAALGEDVVAAPGDWESELCGCLGGVIGTLKPQHAELLRRVDLNGESVQDVAKTLGITANNASVTLHRGRKELRMRLETFCGDCAAGACLDCDCGASDEGADRSPHTTA
jgi:RNA polymerase sigma factor (sigma-70 family)